MAQTLVVSSLINFATRIQLFRAPTTVSTLSFWSAVSIPRFDAKLARTRLAPVALMLSLNTLLAALWTGSLTPLATVTSRDDGEMLVPFFNQPLVRTMYPRESDGAIITQCGNVSDPRGPQYRVLDNCIVLTKLGNLIQTASTATTLLVPREHPKLGNSTWTYKGRSYGKGSSAGVLNLTNTKYHATDGGYAYNESGYMTSVSCDTQPNSTTIFPFTDTGAESGLLGLWSSDTVVLDTGNISIPPFDVAAPRFDGYNTQPFGYFAWTAFPYQGAHYIATAIQPDSWAHGQNILCNVFFTPMNFTTNVSRIDRVITVTPQSELAALAQTGNIADAIMLDLDLLSRMGSSSMAWGALYYAILANQPTAATLVATGNGTASGVSPWEQSWELALQNAITEVADDLLTYQGFLALARDAGEAVAQPVQRHFAAVRIGQTPYHVAQLVISLVPCAAYLAEVLRTRYWRRLPAFDFLDVKALTLAALGPAESTDEDGAASQSGLSSGRQSEDSRRLMAYHDEQGRPRLRCVEAGQGGRGQYVHLLGDRAPSASGS
ncbi:hypothetical protein LTR53_006324 [Teratosphaeriaceae sp. CCFEE 6253]|nr:hypothetical protein LTR53_006324 [Teratosphaeriaceae sp. CCFEE 6253]